MLVLLFACSGPDPIGPSDEVAAVELDAARHAASPGATPRAALPHGPTPHDATPHSHTSTHGGELRAVGDLHVEVRFLRSGVMAWLTDAADRPVDPATVPAEVVLRDADGVRTVPMVAMGDHLHAASPLAEGAPADAVLTFTYGGKPFSADFRTPAVGSLATHDHTALHGGVVSMWGDVHVEYRPDGEHVRFWVTDAARVPVRDAVSGTATIGGAAVPLTFDPGTGALSGAASPRPGERVTLDARVGGTAFSLVFGG